MRVLNLIGVKQSLTQFCNYYIQMSRSRTEINQSLSSLILFLRLFKTFDIGELASICQKVEEQPSLYEDKGFSKLLSQFIFHVNQENKKNHGQQQYLALMIAESIIYNLYRHNNKNNMNNSIYSNSLMISSASQIGLNDQSMHSIKHLQSIQEHFSLDFVSFIRDFISDTDLLKKIKQMIQRGTRKAIKGVNQNQRYADILLQTIEYILNKQGNPDKNKEEFQFIKQTVGSKNPEINSEFQKKKNLKIMIGEVNKVIFSRKLNRIALMLQQSEQKVYFSLLRIYFGQSFEDQSGKAKNAKYFAQISVSGEQMLLNLTKAYVQSINNKTELFQVSKNPFYRLIQSYLLSLYMPLFRQFNQIIGKCCKYDFGEGLQFYTVCEATINKDLYQFVQTLPSDLCDYLREIYRIILISMRKDNTSNSSTTAIIAVKRLFIYSLLVRPVLIETYYSQGADLQKYEQACNNIINLFFKSSLKKYHQFSEEAVATVSILTKSISNKMDQRIIGPVVPEEGVYLSDFERSIDVKNYIIEEPILNHDYETLWEKIKSIQFTPKDLKEFQMIKKADILNFIDVIQTIPTGNNSLNNTNTLNPVLNFSPRQNWLSPMQKAKKQSLQFNQSIDYNLEHGLEQSGFPEKQEIDFLTWMTVGGNQDYDSKSTTTTTNFRHIRSTTFQPKQNKIKFQTFSREKIKQISHLYQKYQRIMS